VDDPLWHLARVAMHFDGAEGSTAAVDLKGNAFTAYGNAHITTADGVFGGSCAVFDGAGDYFRSDLPMPSLSFAYEPFSIAFWVRTTAAGVVVLDFDDTYAGGLWQVKINGAGAIEVIRASVVWLTGTVAVNDGAWHRVVVGKVGSRIPDLWVFIAVDGVQCGLVKSNDTFATTNSRLAIGAQVLTRDPAKDFIGKIDDLVIHLGNSGVADFAFGLPPAAFGDTFGGVVSALLGGPFSAAVGSPLPAMSPALVHSCGRLVDLENGGIGRVVGTTKNVGNPDYAVSRRVRLLRKRDCQLAREQWSDAAGNYEFAHVRHDVEYIVLGQDHTGVYNAVIADSVIPDLMP
jgi:hypothetical protein